MALGTGRGAEAVNVSIAFTVLALIVVALRLYTRFFLVRQQALEDYLAGIAMLCSLGFTLCIAFQAKYGMGKHIVDIPPGDVTKSLKAFYASLIVYYLALGFTKSSILIQYLRLFPTKKFRIWCWGIMFVVVAYSIYTLFVNIFMCVPVRGFWTHEPTARCVNQFALWFTNAAINIVTDFAIIILPMPVIRRLNLPRNQKHALLGVFAVGGVVCVVSILRLRSLIAISNSPDPTYDNPPAATWTSVETNVGIICCCLPPMRPLLARCLPAVFAEKSKRGTNHTPKWTPSSRNRWGRRTHEAIAMESHDSVWAKSQNIEVVTDIQVDYERRSVNEINQSEGRVLAVPPNVLQKKKTGGDRSGRSESLDSLVKDVKNVV